VEEHHHQQLVAGWSAMPVWREKSAVAAIESIWERERRVLMTEGSDTKLRRSKRYNL
jgi:hypothetical protein